MVYCRECHYFIAVADAFFYGTSCICVEVDEIPVEDVVIYIDRNANVVLCVADFALYLFGKTFQPLFGDFNISPVKSAGEEGIIQANTE